MATRLQISVREFQVDDYPVVKEIYQQGIDTKNATFDTMAPDFAAWDSKFLKQLRLVALAGPQVVGWAGLFHISPRPVYRGVCEVSVYIHSDFWGKGVGRRLLAELITRSEQQGIWTLQAGIFPENTASIELHKQLGFRQVGYRECIGKMDDRWRDTIFLERRSKVVGS